MQGRWKAGRRIKKKSRKAGRMEGVWTDGQREDARVELKKTGDEMS